jgi:hypothetical protein
MIHWARHEAEQYSLDWQASILFELEGLSQEADCLGMSVTEQAYQKVGYAHVLALGAMSLGRGVL